MTRQKLAIVCGGEVVTMNRKYLTHTNIFSSASFLISYPCLKPLVTGDVAGLSDPEQDACAMSEGMRTVSLWLMVAWPAESEPEKGKESIHARWWTSLAGYQKPRRGRGAGTRGQG